MTSALDLSNSLYGFDIYLKETRLSRAYDRHFWKSRIAMVSIGAVSGIAKVFLFPLISLVGIVAFPAIAIYRLIKGKEGAGTYFKAAAFCMLGVFASLAFISVSAYFLPLVWSCALFATAIVISIAIHVYKMAKTPPYVLQ